VKGFKKIISFFLVIVLAAAFSACQSSPKPASGDNTKAGEKLTVGLALSGITTNAVFIDMTKSIQKLCDDAGYKLMTADIQGDPNNIVKAIENFVNGGCKVIIIQNYAEQACADAIQNAISKGVVFGSYDYTSQFAQYAIVASNYEVGKVIGQQTGKWVHNNPGSKKVVLCSYPDLDFLVERAKGMKEGFLQECPEGQVVQELKAGFAPEGVTAGENFLQANPDLQAVMGINDGGTLGVYQAFKAAGKSKADGIGIFGCDASLDGLNAIKENDMFISTVDLDLVNQISELYKRCVDAALNGKVDDSKKTVTYPITPITIDNINTMGK
jgi:ABC-type sugar transport system substrate-binding protein